MFDMQIEFGGNNVPYINIVTADNTYNLLYMLEDNKILSMIHMIRDIIGVGLVAITILSVILNISALLSGEFYGRND